MHRDVFDSMGRLAKGYEYTVALITRVRPDGKRGSLGGTEKVDISGSGVSALCSDEVEEFVLKAPDIAARVVLRIQSLPVPSGVERPPSLRLPLPVLVKLV